MTNQVDTKKYVEFVKEVTSAPSLDWMKVLSSHLTGLEVNGANVTQLALLLLV